MIDSFLMSVALASGALRFEERKTDFRLYTNALGMKITLAAVSKKYLADILAQTADGSLAPVSAPETPAETRRAPVSPNKPPARQRPQLRVVANNE